MRTGVETAARPAGAESRSAGAESQSAARPAQSRPAAGTTGPLARTRFATWAPRRRTHLLCVACAGLLTLFSITGMYPLHPEWIGHQVAGGLGVALVSVWPLGGGALSLLASGVFQVMARGAVGPVLPALGPWLCASVLLSRGFNRVVAYGLAALNVALEYVTFQLSARSSYESEFYVMLGGAGCFFLIIAELMRRPRRQADAVADRYREDLERQRLLVVSELHDTVVRDLTRAVTAAEQARLAQPRNAPLSPELAAMTASVRAAVEQLRGNLRAVNDAGGAAGLDVLASSAPRPLAEVVDEARAVLAGRGIALEAVGLEALDADAVPPGVRQQLARVLGELVSNMTKYAAPGGARILMETDGLSLEAMVSNAVAPERGGGRHHGPAGPGGGRRDGPGDGPGSGRRDGPGTGPEGGRAGRDAPWHGPEARDSAVFSSGLGLPGARRRVEALGGTFDVARTAERFTAVLSVPLRVQ